MAYRLRLVKVTHLCTVPAGLHPCVGLPTLRVWPEVSGFQPLISRLCV